MDDEAEPEPAVSYPAMAVAATGVEPCPRRIRGVIDGRTVLDTTRAVYVWDRPNYPQWFVPLTDVDAEIAREHGRPSRRHGAVLDGMVRFRWEVMDAWFEEDEEVFVHPRNPYTRVDALRAHRDFRAELDGVVLAEARSLVLVFETGLPTRYYLARTDVHFEHLRPSPSVSSCPYKGTTSAYWSAVVDGQEHADIAWSYAFPTTALAPIAGLVAFYNEEVDLYLDGSLLPREHAPSSSRMVERSDGAS